jgi:hypothetical protein
MGIQPTEELYWEIEDDVYQLQRQLLFVLGLWHDRDENYERVPEAVRLSAQELRKKAQAIKDTDDRQEMLRKIGRVLSVISFHNEYAPYVPGSGGQRPARPKGRIRSVTPVDCPGLGSGGSPWSGLAGQLDAVVSGH